MAVIEDLKIYWGTFEFDHEVHIAPCDENGIVLKPHRFDELCECNPEIKCHERILIVHNDSKKSRMNID